MKYRELGLKSKVDSLSTKEAIDILLSDGMLIKRPLVLDLENKIVCIGFKEKEWERDLKK